MAPYTGALRRSLVPYSGAQVWGTGINPVHEIYGSPADRLEPYPTRTGEVSPPGDSIPEDLIAPELWGYLHDNTRNDIVDYDDRPTWNQQPPEFRGETENQPSWDAPQIANENFRGMFSGAHRLWRGKLPRADYQIPSETVSEGWRNKPKGTPADAKPSDPSQYEIQTSMTQRYETRVNDHAVARDTDAPRSSIASRVIGQIQKTYSGGRRHYDMFPRQQAPIVRPFLYRTAGTGRPYEMLPNETFDQYPVQREIPPDPYLGPQVSELGTGYGYTPEDMGVQYA